MTSNGFCIRRLERKVYVKGAPVTYLLYVAEKYRAA